jgi:hypothetical protein
MAALTVVDRTRGVEAYSAPGAMTELARTLVLVEAYRVVAPLDLAAMVPQVYRSARSIAVRGFMLEAVRRVGVGGFVDFLLPLVLDDRPVTREARAYDVAISLLEHQTL